MTGVETKRPGRTRLTWAEGLGHGLDPAGTVACSAYVFRQRAALFGHNAPRCTPDCIKVVRPPPEPLPTRPARVPTIQHSPTRSINSTIRTPSTRRSSGQLGAARRPAGLPSPHPAYGRAVSG